MPLMRFDGKKIDGDLGYAVAYREDEVDGLGGWFWPVADDGAWVGPKADWEHHHREKYFKHVRNFDVVVTAGACCGMYVRHYSRRFGKVYAFEPDPVNFFCLVNNCQDENVVKMQCALGRYSGLVGLANYSEVNVGTHTITSPLEGFKVPMITIDSLHLDACDLIQLDVEHYEPNVIAGAMETIARFKPVIVTELESAEVVEMISQHGYMQVETSASDRVYARP